MLRSAIKTHNNQGTTKPGVNERHFCQVYSGISAPPLLEEEVLRTRPIKVELDQKAQPLRNASRINLWEVHTVQHNQPVQSIGKVAEKDNSRLKKYVSDLQTIVQREGEVQDDLQDDEDDEKLRYEGKGKGRKGFRRDSVAQSAVGYQ
jgi:hypothetical protein